MSLSSGQNAFSSSITRDHTSSARAYASVPGFRFNLAEEEGMSVSY